MLPDITMMSLKFHIRDIMLAFLKRTRWLTCWPTSTFGKKLTVLVYWVPFICSCRPALCVWHSLVASHFITRILTTRILLIAREVNFAVASDELKRERVKEFVPKRAPAVSEESLCTAFSQLPSQAASPGWGRENALCHVLLLEVNAFSKALALLY